MTALIPVQPAASADPTTWGGQQQHIRHIRVNLKVKHYISLDPNMHMHMHMLILIYAKQPSAFLLALH